MNVFGKKERYTVIEIDPFRVIAHGKTEKQAARIAAKNSAYRLCREIKKPRQLGRANRGGQPERH